MKQYNLAGSEEYTDIITICEEITKPNIYLSLKTLKALKIVDEDFPQPIIAGNYTPSDNLEEIKKKIMMEYKDIFSSEERLQPMEGDPIKIELREGATPFAIHAGHPKQQRQKNQRAQGRCRNRELLGNSHVSLLHQVYALSVKYR